MALDLIRISKENKNVVGEIVLDGSKSISNRALIIQALCKNDFSISGLSSSDDTQVLSAALNTKKEIYDVGHAGTSFRFMTAFLSIQEGKHILTGSDRMKQRPIGPLVDALNSLGAKIEYLEKIGYPPLSIDTPSGEWKNNVELEASISSQFISALCLIAPCLPNGLTISLKGDMVSKSYLEMTLQLMQSFGIDYLWNKNVISINNQSYKANDFEVEADWSAASYYYILAAISDESKIKLSGLYKNSLQGDSAIAEWAHKLGVKSEFVEDLENGGRHLILSSQKESIVPMFEHDFLLHPDIAQSIAVICAANGIQGLFTGLQTLKIKETNRIDALQKELLKIQVFFNALPSGKFSKKSGKQYYMLESKANFTDIPSFDTYDDHRMAMAFAPLALLHEIEINDAMVVSKSYPNFWDDLAKLGFQINSMD